MVTLKVKLANRTERIVFQTMWAANIRARDILSACPEVDSVEIVDECGILQSAYLRK